MPCVGIAETNKLQQEYPHWNLQNKHQYEIILKLNKFIKQNKNRGYGAVFDWDGTLFCEKIPYKINGKKNTSYGEIAWVVWEIHHLGRPGYKHVLPMFHTKDGQWKNNALHHLKFIAGKTNVPSSEYLLISQFSAMQANMTPQELNFTVTDFLHQYQPKDYAFLPMLDVMQRLIDTGFNVWIVSGSNAYYLLNLIKNIEQNIEYQPNKNYHFAAINIIGNQSKLMPNGKFSVVYDDTFVKNKQHKLYIVDGYGKLLAIKNYINTRIKKPVIFYAGNSSGDFYGMRYVLQQPKTIAIAVNPIGTLNILLKKYPQKILVVNCHKKTRC
jgi:hypothetical protein